MKIQKLIIASTLSLISLNAFSSAATDKAFINNVKNQGLKISDQSYCYTDEQGVLQGMNTEMRIRLASTSKLVTSFWSIEKLGIDYVFPLKLYIKGNNLHLEGSYDPFFNDEKLFYLVSQLNELGYEKFEKITFDKFIFINPDALYGADEHPVLNASTNTRYIRQYFNTANWSTKLKEDYSNFYAMAKSGKYKKDVNLGVDTIEFSEINPYANDAEAKVLTLNSPPLYKYLKEMNVKSNNYVAESLFRKIGNVKEFDKFIAERFSLTRDSMHMWTGSGLPYVDENGTRFDNYATCTIMTNFVNELKESAERQGRNIQDVVAVPGNDKGTFRNRIFPGDFKNSFTAKSGTLMHTSALLGSMNTQKGFSFYGVFNQTTDIHGAKAVQNEMVKSIMMDLGGPKAFDYEVEGFHTYGNDPLKNNLYIEDESDFSSVEGKLE